MTTELDLISTKMKQFLYQMFITNVRKLFLNNGSIKSIECLGVMSNLEFIVVSNYNMIQLKTN